MVRFLPKRKPMQHACSHYNAFSSITSQTCTYLRTWQHQMTTIMQPFHCDLQFKTRIELRTGTTTRCRTQRRNTFADDTTAAATAARRRYTFHRRPKPLYTEKHKVLCSGFLPDTSPMQNSCSHYNAFRSITLQTCTYLCT